MKWGDHRAIVTMTQKLVNREGFGDLVADGTKVAAERIGKGAEQYAMHIGGQEISAHDPRGGWGFAIGYGTDPTPGRHNQGGGQHPPGVVEDVDRENRTDQNRAAGMGLMYDAYPAQVNQAGTLQAEQKIIDDSLEDTL